MKNRRAKPIDGDEDSRFALLMEQASKLEGEQLLALKHQLAKESNPEPSDAACRILISQTFKEQFRKDTGK